MLLPVLLVVLCLVVGGNCWTYPPSVDPSSSTRLVGSGVPWEGRLEVYYNGEWGAVCSNGFDYYDAIVACYSMGYGRNGYDIGNAYLPATGRIWLDWVGCNGYESWIGECSNSGWGQTSCGQWSVISVHCSGGTDETSLPPTTVAYDTATVANPTRLVGSGYHDRGRVEVYHNGQWGTVCDDMFDDVDAQVVCYSLGFGRVGRAAYEYAGGSGQIWLDDLNCNGYETFIGDCPHIGWGVHNCDHIEDVGVVCSGSTDTMTTADSRTVDYYTGDPSQVTRLVGSGWPDRGRVEVLNQNTWQWGTVCKDNFDDTDARVVCFSLGYGYNGQFIGNTYGEGSGPIWLDEVRCVGTETFIGNCPHNGWGVTDCGHYEDVSVECYSTSPSTAAWPVTSESTTQSPQTTTYTVNPYWSTRLVGSGWSGEGRLEVLYNGQWGAVCSNMFSDVDARVACNSLGYGYTGHYIGNVYTPATYIWLDYVGCNGWESWIGYCPHNGWGMTNCNVWNVVSVSCLSSNETAEVASTTETTTATTAELSTAATGTVDPYWSTRLVGSGVSWEGRLEVLYNGQWGAVCSNMFSDVDARVACNSLGYGYTGYYIGNVYTPANYIWLDYVNCYGWESWIGYCPHNGWGYTSCGSWSVVSIRCQDTTTAPETSTATTTTAPETTYETTSVASSAVDPYWSTRLVGSVYSWEGRLEVLYNGQWGAVCSNSFSDVDARVACNSLGYGYTGYYIGNTYTPANYIWLDYVNCAGWESWIGYCPHNGWGYTTCSSWSVVSINCLEAASTTTAQTTTIARTTTANYYGATRLVGGYYSDRGRVEVLYNGVWGTVCDDSFDDTDARVVCNSLGFGYSGRFVGSLYGEGTGQIWLDEVGCYGYESFIGNCPHSGWGVHDCKHTEDVSVECFQATTAGQPPTTLTTKGVETTTTRGDTTTSSTTTGTTGTSTTTTTTTTTSPGFPDITSPFMEESLAGLMEAVDGTMTMSCLHRYTQQFQEVLKGQLERAKEEMVASSSFCEGFTDGKLITAYINMLQSGVEVGLMFGVDVISYGTDAISSIETCGWQLGDYLSDFNNWRQPIWTDINQCPRLVFTSSQFNVTEVNWKCHP